MNAAIYRDILDKNLLTYAEEKMPQDWIFQQDNDPKHTLKLLKEWFSAKNVSFNLAIPVTGLEPDRTFVGTARSSNSKAYTFK